MDGEAIHGGACHLYKNLRVKPTLGDFIGGEVCRSLASDPLCDYW